MQEKTCGTCCFEALDAYVEPCKRCCSDAEAGNGLTGWKDCTDDDKAFETFREKTLEPAASAMWKIFEDAMTKEAVDQRIHALKNMGVPVTEETLKAWAEKQRERVEIDYTPNRDHKDEGPYGYWIPCPKCGEKIFAGDIHDLDDPFKYCPGCGVELVWRNDAERMG